jgi:apolipoprotein N-acyltransferase
LGQAGYLDAVLPAPGPPTVYSRFGDGLVFLLLGLFAVGYILSRRGFGD